MEGEVRSNDIGHRSAVDAVMNSSGVIRGNASGSGEDSRSRSAVYSLRMGGTTLMLTLFAISPVPSTNEGVRKYSHTFTVHQAAELNCARFVATLLGERRSPSRLIFTVVQTPAGNER